MASTASSGGPYLLVACFCENVVQRADQVLTLVNIVDRVNITAQGSEAPETMPPTPYPLYLVLNLKAGRARGRYEVRITADLPDGSSKVVSSMSANFEGEDDRGVQLVNQMHIMLSQEGLHWFRVEVGGSEITRLPLRVVYNRIVGGVAPQGTT